MDERRDFLKKLGLFGAGVGAFAAAPGVATAFTLYSESSSDKDGPIDENVLTFQAGTKLKPKKPTYSSYVIQPSFNQYEEYKTVKMSVGQDGNLWMKTEDGPWKRIVTE